MMRKTLLLLALIVLAGCTSLPTNGGGGEEDKPKRLEFGHPACIVNGEPCSSQEVTRFARPTVSLTVTNYGTSSVDVALNTDGSSTGRRVLVSDCNVFDVTSFTAEKRSNTITEDVADRERVDLQKGASLELEWRLEIPEGRDISRLGYTCPLGFAMTFNQTMNVTKQVQVREDETVPEVSTLDESTTSIYPVKLNIESDQHVVAQRDGTPLPFVARAYLENVGSGEVELIGHSDYDHGIELAFNGDVFPDYHIGPPPAPMQDEHAEEGGRCSLEEQVVMYRAGDREGQSLREVCQFKPQAVTGSQVFDLFAETEYKYRVDLGDITIQVVPLEG